MVKRTLVIDLGSSEVRAGWTTDAEPTVRLEPYVLKSTERSSKSNGSKIVGQRYPRSRGPFENGIIVNSEILECVFDAIFHQLGLSNNPPTCVVVTEPLCTPPLSRAIVAELLYEIYGVDQVAFAIDSVCSLYKNILETQPNWTGSLLSLSASGATILPFKSGVADFSNACRVPVGEAEITEYMRRLLVVKYPDFQRVLGPTDYSAFYQQFCYVATDYNQELVARLHGNDIVIQFPPATRINATNLDRVKLTQEEQNGIEFNKAQWVMGLVHERQQQIQDQISSGRRGGTSGSKLVKSKGRRRNDTQSKMRTMVALIDKAEDSGSKSGKRKRKSAAMEAAEEEAFEMFVAMNEAQEDPAEEAIALREARVERLLAEYDPFRFYQMRKYPLLARLIQGHREEFNATSIDRNAKRDYSRMENINDFSLAGQIRLNIEQIRVPELYFKPWFSGIDSRGISEALAGAKNVFVTGGMSKIPGLEARLALDLQPEVFSLKNQSETVKITIAEDHILNTWHGARDAAVNKKLLFSTRSSYQSKGLCDWFVRHVLSNMH